MVPCGNDRGLDRVDVAPPSWGAHLDLDMIARGLTLSYIFFFSVLQKRLAPAGGGRCNGQHDRQESASHEGGRQPDDRGG